MERKDGGVQTDAVRVSQDLKPQAKAMGQRDIVGATKAKTILSYFVNPILQLSNKYVK